MCCESAMKTCALPLFERCKQLRQHIGPVAAIKIIEHIESHVNRNSARLSTAIMKASLRSEWMRRIGGTAQREAEDQEPRLLKTRSGRVEGQGEGNGVSGSKLLRMF